jgi:hypothetical protein
MPTISQCLNYLKNIPTDDIDTQAKYDVSDAMANIRLGNYKLFGIHIARVAF